MDTNSIVVHSSHWVQNTPNRRKNHPLAWQTWRAVLKVHSLEASNSMVWSPHDGHAPLPVLWMEATSQEEREWTASSSECPRSCTYKNRRSMSSIDDLYKEFYSSSTKVSNNMCIYLMYIDIASNALHQRRGGGGWTHANTTAILIVS